MKRVIWFLLLCLIATITRAEEGMWIPLLLKKYNIEEMQQKGFKLTAEDIYDINQASLKDGVVGLGREGRPFHHFCTGEFVSKEGLLFTNHHCVYGMIQTHSSLENNYLRDGFWARNRSEELRNPGITASILIRMEDVTEDIIQHLTEEMTPAEREKAIKKISSELEKKAVEGTDLQANIKPYFYGNQYFLSVFRVYKDVRLVGAPPSAVGKFGGDTDNWTWPRHTGDFALLRVYTGENNEPAEYAENNRPFQPDHHFKISARGVQEGDFTMVFGYPGTTMEYLPSYAIEQLLEMENPARIAIRTAKLNIINSAINSDELLRIKYSAKAANVANGWKKWQGEIKGLVRYNTVENKQHIENEFRRWAAGKPAYEGITEKFKSLYEKMAPLNYQFIYATEAGLSGSEIFTFSINLVNMLAKYTDTPGYQERIKNMIHAFYKDFDSETDRKVLQELLNIYINNVDHAQLPEELARIARGKGVEHFVTDAYKKSVFSDADKLNRSLKKLTAKTYLKLEKDPLYIMAKSIYDHTYTQIRPALLAVNGEIENLNRHWLAGLMEMQPEKRFYPDANSTLRIAYGEVGGYIPRDAVQYTHYTTLKGIMEKDDPQIYDYDIPQKLRDLYREKDFGRYTQDGEVPVCFIASNHTTGGNSGSPVLNAEGHLIGINFDRAWEGVMSDLQYSPDICRNISIDIRYALFIIEKLAGATHLIEEMEVVY